MDSSDWVAIVIAGLGIAGTLSGAVFAQAAEAKRASHAEQVEMDRRDQERQDSLARERREALRSDYREILRFVTRTRLFVMVLRDRLGELEAYSASVDDDSREIEDLDARSEMLRLRLLEEVPEVQSLVGVWAPKDLLEIFDQIYGSGSRIRAFVTASIHFKYDGRLHSEGIKDALEAIERLLSNLNEARDLLQADHLPSR